MLFGGQMLRKAKVRTILFQACLSLETNISQNNLQIYAQSDKRNQSLHSMIPSLQSLIVAKVVSTKSEQEFVGFICCSIENWLFSLSLCFSLVDFLCNCLEDDQEIYHGMNVGHAAQLNTEHIKAEQDEQEQREVTFPMSQARSGTAAGIASCFLSL